MSILRIIIIIMTYLVFTFLRMASQSASDTWNYYSGRIFGGTKHCFICWNICHVFVVQRNYPKRSLHSGSRWLTIRFFGNSTFLSTLKEIERGKWEAGELSLLGQMDEAKWPFFFFFFFFFLLFDSAFVESCSPSGDWYQLE